MRDKDNRREASMLRIVSRRSLSDLTVSQLQHDRQTQARLEEEKRRHDLEERRKLVAFQVRHLLEDFQKVIIEFNSQSSFGQIQTDWLSEGLEEKITNQLDDRWDSLMVWNSFAVRIRLPRNGEVSIKFFTDSRLNRLGIGKVEFAAILRGKVGDLWGSAQFIFLLCRTDDQDLYGKWRVGQIKYLLGGPYTDDNDVLNRLVPNALWGQVELSILDDTHSAFPDMLQYAMSNQV